MASSPQSFNKRQRERAKKEKAAAKRARRHARPDDEDVVDEGPSEDELLEQFRVLSEQRDAGTVTSEDFEARRLEIFEQLGLGEG